MMRVLVLHRWVDPVCATAWFPQPIQPPRQPLQPHPPQSDASSQPQQQFLHSQQHRQSQRGWPPGDSGDPARMNVEPAKETNDDSPQSLATKATIGDAAANKESSATAGPEARAAAVAIPVPPVVAEPPAAPPFGSSGAAASARLSREVPGLGLVPDRLFFRSSAESQRLLPLPHLDPRVPIDWKSKLPPVMQVRWGGRRTAGRHRPRVERPCRGALWRTSLLEDLADQVLVMYLHRTHPVHPSLPGNTLYEVPSDS